MPDQPASPDGADTAATSARVSLRELLDAFEFVNFQSGLGDNQALICRQTGKIYWRFEESELDELEELPDDIDDAEKYVPVPDKRELDLGSRLVLSFAREFLPEDFASVRDMFSRRGAYGQFKALLAHRKAVDRWYEFEAKATEQTLRDWCEINSIALAD
jgi:hypothetical protein